MAHFAQLDENNVVTQVIVINNGVIKNLPFPESEPVGIEFCQSLYGADTVWKQTSYNASFRKNYAGIGSTYNAEFDAFIPAQPQPECTLDVETFQWHCPFPPIFDGEHVVEVVKQESPAITDPNEMP